MALNLTPLFSWALILKKQAIGVAVRAVMGKIRDVGMDEVIKQDETRAGFYQ